jgi:hypothetical protein
MSEYGCGRFHPRGGAKNAVTNDKTVAITYLFRTSSSTYSQTGIMQMSKMVARLIKSDLGSWPAVFFDPFSFKREAKQLRARDKKEYSEKLGF